MTKLEVELINTLLDGSYLHLNAEAAVCKLALVVGDQELRRNDPDRWLLLRDVLRRFNQLLKNKETVNMDSLFHMVTKAYCGILVPYRYEAKAMIHWSDGTRFYQFDR